MPTKDKKDKTKVQDKQVARAITSSTSSCGSPRTRHTGKTPQRIAVNLEPYAADVAKYPYFAQAMSETKPPRPRAKRFIQPNTEAIAAALAVG